MSKLPTRTTVAGTTLSGANLKAVETGTIDALNSAGIQESNRTVLTTSTTLTITQCGLVLVDCSSASVVLTLPASGTGVTDDAIYNIRRADVTPAPANTLTVIRGGTDTLEGATTALSITNNGLLDLQMPAGASNWRVMGLLGATALASRNAISANDSIFRNRVINGNFFEDQRNAAASQTFTAAAVLAYCADMFYGYCTGANVTGQQITATDGTKRYRYTGAASVTGIGLGHRIEAANSVDLAGNVCTLSAKLSNSLLTTVTWAAYYANTSDTFGTLAAPTRTLIATNTFTVTSTETLYSTQINVPSAATTGVEIVLSVGAQVSGTWTLGDVQLEKGAVPLAAISFERVDVQVNKARCQRYYEKSYDTGTAPGTATVVGAMRGNALSAGDLYAGNIVSFKVTKRVIPTMQFWSGATGNQGFFRDETAVGDVGAPALLYASAQGGYLYNSSALFTAGRFYNCQWAASAVL